MGTTDGFLSDAEVAWVNKGHGVYIYHHAWQGFIRDSERGSANRHHPTQKPVRVMEELINRYTAEGDVVFDPFMGAGSTGVAAINTDRKFIGIELDPEYFDIAARRIANASGDYTQAPKDSSKQKSLFWDVL